jgi:chromosome partitioning protein
LPRIIAIANQKGGVGKTTTAVNVGASLAVAEKRTLIVDVDPQGNSTSGLGIDRKALTQSLYDALAGSVPLSVVMRPGPLDHLWVVPSSKDLVGAEIELVGVEKREYLLQQTLAPLKGDFAYVILDCPPSLGLLTLNALVAADSVIVPLQCEYYALEGLTSLLETIKLVQSGLNPRLGVEGILLTMYDTRNKLAHQVSQEVRSHFPDKIFQTIIHRNVRLSESPSHGKPALLYDVHSVGAQNYLALAKELISREESQHAETGTG